MVPMYVWEAISCYDNNLLHLDNVITDGASAVGLVSLERGNQQHTAKDNNSLRTAHSTNQSIITLCHCPPLERTHPLSSLID